MSKRILIIDDDEAVRRSFILAFEDIGFKVDTAESGEKGLQMKNQAEYDLIFLDLKMPGMDGVETLRQIRKNDKKVPIYIFTAFHKEFMDQLRVAAGEGEAFTNVGVAKMLSSTARCGLSRMFTTSREY